MQVIDFLLNINKYVETLVLNYGLWAYFIIAFCESGIILLPFLPGDALMFAAGAYAASGKLNIWWLYALSIISAVLGDIVNYELGRLFDKKILRAKRLVDPKKLNKADAFVAKYGGNAIFWARFIPVIRSTVPFVVGAAEFDYKKFLRKNFEGAFVWVTLLLGLGYFTGNMPNVKDKVVMIAFIVGILAFVPMVISIIKSGIENKKNKKEDKQKNKKDKEEDKGEKIE